MLHFINNPSILVALKVVCAFGLINHFSFQQVSSRAESSVCVVRFNDQGIRSLAMPAPDGIHVITFKSSYPVPSSRKSSYPP